MYSLRPKTSYLWVITPTRQQFYQIAGSETILPLIQLHTKMILASKDLLSQPTAPGRTLYDKLVDSHVVRPLDEAGVQVLLYIDRRVLNEYTSPQAFTGLRQAGRPA